MSRAGALAGVEWTPAQVMCIDTLAVFASGHHHLPKTRPHGQGVEINWRGDLSTFDGDDLTRLVLVAHAYAVRISIQSSGPGMVKIVAFQRQHGSEKDLRFYERHPTIGDLAARAFKMDGEIAHRKSADQNMEGGAA